MLFGHNSDVKVGASVYHVQTEDRGTNTALIDTTVYSQGRVLHRKTNNYRDLLPLNTEQETLLRKRIDDQHRSIIEWIRTGGLQPSADAAPAPSAQKSPANAPSPQTFSLELLNAKTWLSGKRASLQIAVRQQQNGSGLFGAKILVRIDGSATKSEFSAQTGPDGQAQVEFEMPSLNSHEAALVIEAVHGAANGHLRYQLRAKPRVPAG